MVYLLYNRDSKATFEFGKGDDSGNTVMSFYIKERDMS